MFIETTISDKTFKTLLDTGASYLLVSSDGLASWALRSLREEAPLRP